MDREAGRHDNCTHTARRSRRDVRVAEVAAAARMASPSMTTAAIKFMQTARPHAPGSAARTEEDVVAVLRLPYVPPAARHSGFVVGSALALDPASGA